MTVHDAKFYSIVLGIKDYLPLRHTWLDYAFQNKLALLLVLYFMLSNDYSMSAKLLMHPNSVLLHYLRAPLLENYDYDFEELEN